VPRPNLRYERSSKEIAVNHVVVDQERCLMMGFASRLPVFRAEWRHTRRRRPTSSQGNRCIRCATGVVCRAGALALTFLPRRDCGR